MIGGDPRVRVGRDDRAVIEQPQKFVAVGVTRGRVRGARGDPGAIGTRRHRRFCELGMAVAVNWRDRLAAPKLS